MSLVRSRCRRRTEWIGNLGSWVRNDGTRLVGTAFCRWSRPGESVPRARCRRCDRWSGTTVRAPDGVPTIPPGTLDSWHGGPLYAVHHEGIIVKRGGSCRHCSIEIDFTNSTTLRPSTAQQAAGDVHGFLGDRVMKVTMATLGFRGRNLCLKKWETAGEEDLLASGHLHDINPSPVRNGPETTTPEPPLRSTPRIGPTYRPASDRKTSLGSGDIYGQ